MRNRGVVASHGQSFGKSHSDAAVEETSIRKSASLAAMTLRLLTSVALVNASVAPAFADALPQGGSVAAGSVSISTPSATQMTINQSSQNAVVNWQSFNVGAGSRVDINQPNSSSALLNRVTGSTNSTIAGQINANGQVYLVNPNGITITKSGAVKAGGGFVASSLGISDSDFMDGKRTFKGEGAPVTNHGRISVGRGGYAALIGSEVSNTGTISVPMGKVGLGSGQQATLDLSGDGFLQVAVPAKNGSVSNSGRIRANGGLVEMRAAAARDAARNVVNMSGTIQARSVGGRSGRVVLGGGGGGVRVTGKIDASARATRVARANQNGRTQVASLGKGGSVEITGGDIALSGATINVSGVKGGGTVKIGGDYMGGGSIPHAMSVAIDKATTINADAIESGNGGTIIAWSDGKTIAQGSFSALGGASGGNGGLVETSGHEVDFAGIRVTTNAPAGLTGTWLIDPEDIIINAAEAAILTTALQANNVTLTTTNTNATSIAGIAVTPNGKGDIIVNSGVTVSTGKTLTLNAFRGIIVNAPITVQGTGGVALNYNTADPMNLSFGLASTGFRGRIDYTGAGSLSINSQAYTLITSMAQLDAIDAVSGVTGAAVTAFGTGTGARYALATNLDAAGTTYTRSILANFSGTLEGLGHTISNLTMTLPSTSFLLDDISGFGLVGTLTSTGAVRDVGIASGTISGSYSVGPLVGINLGSVANSYSGAEVRNVIIRFRSDIPELVPGQRLGGLVGFNMSTGQIWQSFSTGAVNGTFAATPNGLTSLQVGGLTGTTYGTIRRSYATGNVSGYESVGGLTGSLDGSGGPGVIEASYATGRVTGTNTSTWVGGLVGNGGGTISNSYATGPVTGGSLIGGLVGRQQGTLSITNSYATGLVSGGSNTGGLVGGNLAGAGTLTVTNSYWDVTSTNQTTSFGGGTGKTTAEMKTLSTFTGWDIDDAGGTDKVWRIYGGNSYPLLRTWLTPLNVVGYDGSGALLTDIGKPVIPAGADASKVFGTTTSNTLTLTAPNANSYNASIDVAGLYSRQDGYDIIGTRAISTPGSAVGEIKLGNVNWINGTLVVNGNVTNAGVIASTQGTFDLAGGTWSQINGLLPLFFVRDFRISGGTFTRALGGTGATNDPYQIYDVYGLQGLGTTLSASAKLDSNINASVTANWWGGQGFKPIGTYNSPQRNSAGKYLGTFDGNFHTISGLTINRPGQGFIGLFGAVGFIDTNSPPQISNVGLIGGSIVGGDQTGSLIGYLLGGSVSNSFSTVDTTGGSNVGGLVGMLEDNTRIQSSYATGRVTGSGDAIGGLVGIAFRQSSIAQSYSTGQVQGAAGVGGLVGSSGLTPDVANSFFNTQTSGQAGSFGGTGKTTAQMQNPFTFIDAGWDFSTVWGKSISGANNGYPVLRGFSNPADLFTSYVRVADATRVYGDTAYTGGAITGVNPNGLSLVFGTGATNVGTYDYSSPNVVTVTGPNPQQIYADLSTGKVTVTPRDVIVTANAAQRAYGDANPPLTYQTNVGGLVNNDQLNGALATTANQQSGVGQYAITQGTLANANYNITFQGAQLTVNPRDVIVTANAQQRAYGDANPALTYTVGGAGLVNNDQLVGSLDTIATQQSGVGQYAITQGTLTNAANANYAITFQGAQLTVNPRDVIVTANAQQRTYGDANPALTYQTNVGGLVNNDQLVGGLNTAATQQSGVGQYAITQGTLTNAANANYNITFQGAQLTVNPRDVIVTANAQQRAYGDANPALTYQTNVGGLVNNDQLNGALATTATQQSGVGQYGITQGTLTSGANANYNITFQGAQLTVNPRDVIVTANAQQRAYGDANPALTYTVGGAGLVNGDQLNGALATTATQQSGIGQYAITQGTVTTAANANYKIAFQGAQLVVNPRDITVAANNASRPFGVPNPALTYQVTAGSLVNGDALQGALATTANLASTTGAYAITQGTLAAPSANYAMTFVPGTLTVTAPLSPPAGSAAPFVTATTVNPWPFVPPMPPLSGDALTGAINGTGPFLNVPAPQICFGGQTTGTCQTTTSSLGSSAAVN